MYADNTLTPKEAARLCALGTLAPRAMEYGELAASVRHFMDRVQGPSLDIMGSSIELLKYEGLVETSHADNGSDMLEITPRGRDELRNLLTANLRPGATDLNKLVVALKFRFLHLLDAAERRDQIDILSDTTETEMARLMDLRGHHQDDAGHFVAWLDAEIDALGVRIDWLQSLRAKMSR